MNLPAPEALCNRIVQNLLQGSINGKRVRIIYILMQFFLYSYYFKLKCGFIICRRKRQKLYSSYIVYYFKIYLFLRNRLFWSVHRQNEEVWLEWIMEYCTPKKKYEWMGYFLKCINWFKGSTIYLILGRREIKACLLRYEFKADIEVMELTLLAFILINTTVLPSIVLIDKFH